ncbi:MAG: tetratricopeptide repeat protein [Bacteroidales bacterium]|nr:tetratricopeptide repeat protein [Bacteroidales bacterium]
MNKIITILLLLVIIWPGEGFSQKREKKKKHKTETTAETAANYEEVTNIYIDATNAKLIGETAKAMGLFESCLAKNPQHSASMYELAQMYFDASDYSMAARYAEQAAELEPENKWYKLLLVEIYGKSGMKKELLETCENLVKQYPGSVDYLYELANAYLINDDGKNAIVTYDKIEEQLGVTEEISLQKHRIYLIQKKTEQATAEIQKLIKEFPDQETRYVSMIAEMYMQAGKPDEAAKYYQQILSKDPDNPYIHITLSDYYRKKGDIKRSIDELKLGFANPQLDIDTKIRVLLAIFSGNEMYDKNKAEIMGLAQILVQTHPDEAKAHSIYGDFLLDDKKYAEARDEFRKVIAIDSSRYAVWESLLNAEIQLSDYPALESESSRAIELFPLLPVPYLFKGVACLEKSKYEDAIESFNSGVKLISGNNILLVQFYTYLGDTYNRLKNYRLSDDNYENALKLQPENSYVLNNYAYYLSLRNENLDKAETMSSKSVKLDPANAANMDTYGWVLYKLGRYSEAVEWVEKAVAATPSPDADLLEHLGDIYFKLGNTDKAMIQWQNAQKNGKGSEFLEKKIKERKLYE